MGDHNVYYVDRFRSFAVINDGALSDDTIAPEDLAPATIDPGLPYRSWAWSSDLNWYFVVGQNWIALFNTHCPVGIISRKKSSELIRMFLDDHAALASMLKDRKETPNAQ